MASLTDLFTNLHSKMVQIFDKAGAVSDNRNYSYATPFSSEGKGAQISVLGATSTG
jgi:hypothetical protein